MDCLDNQNNPNNVSMLVSLKNTFDANQPYFTHSNCLNFIPGLQKDKTAVSSMNWCDSYSRGLAYCIANNACPLNKVKNRQLRWLYEFVQYFNNEVRRRCFVWHFEYYNYPIPAQGVPKSHWTNSLMRHFQRFRMAHRVLFRCAISKPSRKLQYYTYTEFSTTV
jgi:hypothetical protein